MRRVGLEGTVMRDWTGNVNLSLQTPKSGLWRKGSPADG